MSYPAETEGNQVTSWIPLTTVFTPSSGCDTIYRLNGPSLVAYDPGYGLDINTAVACAPPAVTTWWEQARLGLGGSPGHTAVSILPLECPYKWTTVVTSVKDKFSTQAMCCPSGYTLTNGVAGSVAGDCKSSVSKGMILTFASTSYGASEDWKVATTTLASPSNVGAIAIVGWNVAPTSSTAASTTPASFTTASTKAASYVAESLIPSDSQTSPSSTAMTSFASSTIAAAEASPTSDELSTAVTAGIGLGVSLGVIGVAALITAIFMLRRRSRRTYHDSAAAVNVNSGAEGTNSEFKPAPVPQNYYPQQQWPTYELPEQDSVGDPVGYDSRRGVIGELPANDRNPVELDASYDKRRR